MPPSSSYDVQADQELVEAVARGDTEAREQFVQDFGRLIFKIAATVRGQWQTNTVDVEDIVSHIHEKLLEDSCRRLRSWKGMSKLSTYVAMVARNLSIDFLRANHASPAIDLGEGAGAVLPEPFADERESEEAAEKAGKIAALKRAIEDLPDQQRALVLMRLEGSSLRSIAAMLDIPQGTVFVQNSRALNRLKRELTSMGITSA